MKNMSWINGQIAVSGAFADQDIPRLKEEGINAIIDIRSESSDNEELIKKYGMDYLRVKVDDTFTPSFSQLKDVMDFVQPLLDRGRKVLIHCQNGAGRSPLAVVVVLVSRGMTTPDALHLMKRKHPKSGLTDNQRRFLDNQLGTFLKSRKKH
jgi:protein-tyrosine phosphatase